MKKDNLDDGNMIFVCDLKTRDYVILAPRFQPLIFCDGKYLETKLICLSQTEQQKVSYYAEVVNIGKGAQVNNKKYLLPFTKHKFTPITDEAQIQVQATCK